MIAEIARDRRHRKACVVGQLEVFSGGSRANRQGLHFCAGARSLWRTGLLCFVGLLAGLIILKSKIFLPSLTDSASSRPILSFNTLHVIEDFKIQLSLNLNGECLEPALNFWGEYPC